MCHIRCKGNASEDMAQHFLLSARAKTLSTKQVARMSEEDAYKAFVKIRFAENGGEPFCPRCNCSAILSITAKRRSRSKNPDALGGVRRLFRCKACDKQFSVTAGTIFASRKMEFRDILYAICKFANGAKGVSARQMSAEMECNYRTAFVLLHKVREALNTLQVSQMLRGEVEIDATYTGGYSKPSNLVRHRVDRRFGRKAKRKCITIMRERGGRSLPFVSSSSREALPVIMRNMAPGTIGYADEAKEYNFLHAHFQMRRIDHLNTGYSTDEANTNQAESFFSRLKRSIIGIHHHISGPYTQNYAGEMSWREDNRRVSNGEQFLTIVAAGLHHPVSRQMKGYWQRHLRAAA